MKIIKRNLASIKDNNPDTDSRVQLSITYSPTTGSYAIITDCDDEPRYFGSIDDAEKAIGDLWGRSSEWDLQYN